MVKSNTYIKTLTTYFSRHELYVHASNSKKKKMLRRLILNYLLNCVREHFNKPAINFSTEYATDTSKTKVYVPDIRDPCWSSKQILRDLNYNVFVYELNLAKAMQKIRDKLRYRSSSDRSSNGKSSSDITDVLLVDAITAVVNSVYPDDDLSYSVLSDQVMYEIEKRRTRRKPKTIESDNGLEVVTSNLPDEVDAFVFAKYVDAVQKHTEFDASQYTYLAIARFILNKYNKEYTIPMVDAMLSEYIPTGVDKKRLQKVNSLVKKRLNELLNAKLINL
jgi:hypothetical protein